MLCPETLRVPSAHRDLQPWLGSARLQPLPRCPGWLGTGRGHSRVPAHSRAALCTSWNPQTAELRQTQAASQRR